MWPKQEAAPAWDHIYSHLHVYRAAAAPALRDAFVLAATSQSQQRPLALLTRAWAPFVLKMPSQGGSLTKTLARET